VTDPWIRPTPGRHRAPVIPKQPRGSSKPRAVFVLVAAFLLALIPATASDPAGRLLDPPVASAQEEPAPEPTPEPSTSSTSVPLPEPTVIPVDLPEPTSTVPAPTTTVAPTEEPAVTTTPATPTTRPEPTRTRPAPSNNGCGDTA
jgi:hypothetical protein